MIAQAIVREGLKAIGAGGNPVLVKRGIDLAVAALVEHLEKVAHPVSSEQDYARVAAISANDDDAVGAVIAKAPHTVGDAGIVTVEESATHGMSVDFVEGFEFDNGYVSQVRRRAGPGFGDRRLRKLEDLAAITGGAVYSKHSGFTLETMTIDQLGRAAQVRVTENNTTIVGGAGSAADVDFRVTQLRAELDRASFGVDEDVLSERIGALTGRVAVIRVGAPTPAELKETQHRVEDALSATRAAMAEESWPAAVRHCCTPSPHWMVWTSTATMPSAWTSSAGR